MQPLLSRIRQRLERLTLGQQLGLGGVMIGTVALLVTTAYWLQQPEYALLFGDLKPENANQVVQTLEEGGTPYELRDQGTAVYVPSASVHELRLQFSAQGTVQSGQTGYELFDQGTLGMTDFMQELNSKRALEGELAQTVSKVGRVKSARVHIAKPERDPFQDQDEQQATASVVLGLEGSTLSQSQVRGITQLVSGAVEQLSPGQVTVLDDSGNTLSDPKPESEDIQMTSTQLDMQRSVEEELRKQGQSMLKQVLGNDNSVVRVSTELNFDKEVITRSEIDPESQTVISEERTRETTGGGNEGGGNGGGNEGGDGETSTSTSTVRNYEVTRTEERTENSVGDISRLTVSVMVDYKQTGEEEGEPTYEPRTEEEMAKIESAVKTAVGFDEARGDRFTIQQTRFDGTPTTRAGQVVRDDGGQMDTRTYLRYGLLLLAIGAAFWIVRSIGQRLTQAPVEDPTQLQPGLPEGDGEADPELRADSEPQLDEDESPAALQDGDDEEDIEELVLEEDMYTSKLSNEAKARIEARKEMFTEIKNQVEDHPEQTAELIRAWIVEDRST
jgi:flagellar M-ring protein FliF